MEWVRGDVIGYGSFSTVNLAIQKRQNPRFPQIMAVKSASTLSQLDMILREKSILEKLNHCPHIIRCFGGEYTIENGEKTYNLFLEYANGGTLADKMKKNTNRRLPENEIRRYTKSILEGIRYIHANEYVHCDLKPENILIFSSSKDIPTDEAKIADFGLARRAREGERNGVELRGTPLYMSPETVSGGTAAGAPADVWAVGCLVAEMAAGAPAWRCRQGGGGVLPLLMRIGLGDELPVIPGDLSPDGKDFLEKIFVKDPATRWTAEMLLDHPFVFGRFCEEGSPRGPLDWVDEHEAEQSCCLFTEIPSSEFDIWSDFEFGSSERVRKLVTWQWPDWGATDGWINVR